MNKLVRTPLVSIVIPVYNSEEYIEDCLNSVLAQSYPNIEIILVDDCCTDGSMEIVRDIIRERNLTSVRIIHHSRNIGLSAGRNSDIAEANGEYLYFLDSDDSISEDCIQL